MNQKQRENKQWSVINAINAIKYINTIDLEDFAQEQERLVEHQ